MAIAWGLGAYAFDRYKKRKRPAPLLAPPEGADMAEAARVVLASWLARDLVNTPSNDMGPEALHAAAQRVADAHGADLNAIVGDDLLTENYPLIHAVGRAAAEAPRILHLSWGDPGAPRVALVGKGVTFDTGGLDIKPAAGMRMMKKDMGGAAHALALAQIIMDAQFPVKLDVFLAVAENAIAGNAFRPGDVFRTRKGIHIEIGNTDAEGRVILCDALAYGAEGKPALMIDMATLTGAARIALGPQLPALFCRDMAMARDLVNRGLALLDPLWHLPLWAPYHRAIESDIADIVNTGKGGLGGAITAALFLEDFVPADLPWLHLDLFAWNDAARPGRPVGGEAQALRTLLAWLEERFARPA